MKKYKLWAYIYMPILFLCFGYSVLAIVLSPVFDLVKSTVQLVLLDTQPTFDAQHTTLFTEENNNQKDNNTTKKEQPKTISANDITYPSPGDEYGQVTIEKASIKAKLFFGDSPEELRKGVGQYTGSVLPGEVGTSLMGGHNTTDFSTMNLVDVGDKITIQTNYGTYTYKVTKHQIAKFDDKSAIASLFKKEGHKLILYTCYPIDMVGLTDDRLFIYADLESGPLIQ